MTFSEKYNKIKQLADKELTIMEKKMTDLIQTREPLNSYIKDFLTSPSKRVRPLIAVLYTKANGGKISEKQLGVLTAVELVHNASLIHDDIIDGSKFRRGRKTVSAQFGDKLGVIAGDYILSIAMQEISKLNSIEILKKFSKSLEYMCQGEINQNFDRYKIGTIENYIEKSKNKTGYLFETALVCCCMLDKNFNNLSKISEFGINVGIAFQIRDDILNLIDLDNSKPLKNDIAEGIYNAAVIYAGSVENYMAGIEKTRSLLNNYIKRAKDGLKYLPVNDFSIALKEFLELLGDV